MSPAERAIARTLETQLSEYFDGSRREFDVPIDLGGGSEFRRRVWRVMAAIPYGKTLSYARGRRRGRQPQRLPGGGQRLRRQPDRDPDPLSPRRRLRQAAARLRRRPGHQGVVAAARRPGYRPAAGSSWRSRWGSEAVSRVSYKGQASEGKALLETSEIIFRGGDFRLKIPFNQIASLNAAERRAARRLRRRHRGV